MNRGHLHGHPSCSVESLQYRFIHLNLLLFTHCSTALTVGTLTALQAFCAFQGCAWLLVLIGNLKLLDDDGLDSFILRVRNVLARLLTFALHIQIIVDGTVKKPKQ